MEEVCERDNLGRAWQRVRENKGGPGIDGMTIEAAVGYLREHWPTIRDQLLQGTPTDSVRCLSETNPWALGMANETNPACSSRRCPFGCAAVVPAVTSVEPGKPLPGGLPDAVIAMNVRQARSSSAQASTGGSVCASS